MLKPKYIRVGFIVIALVGSLGLGEAYSPSIPTESDNVEYIEMYDLEEEEEINQKIDQKDDLLQISDNNTSMGKQYPSFSDFVVDKGATVYLKGTNMEVNIFAEGKA